MWPEMICSFCVGFGCAICLAYCVNMATTRHWQILFDRLVDSLEGRLQTPEVRRAMLDKWLDDELHK